MLLLQWSGLLPCAGQGSPGCDPTYQVWCSLLPVRRGVRPGPEAREGQAADKRRCLPAEPNGLILMCQAACPGRAEVWLSA